MKVTFITTENHNIGDDFVRLGLENLLTEVNPEIDFQTIHKHKPLSVRGDFYKHIPLSISNFLDSLLPFNTQDKILSADKVIISGAPLYWCHPKKNSHSFQNEWFIPLIKKRLNEKKQIYLLTLAIGSCQNYGDDSSHACNDCSMFLNDLYKHSTLLTVRDKYLQEVYALQSKKVSCIPCPSLFAKDTFGLKKERSDYIVMNCMEYGGHYDFLNIIDKENWQKKFIQLYQYFKTQQQVIISCHSQNEVSLIKNILPNADIFYKENDPKAYLYLYKNASFGIVNRIHAAYALASFGVQSIVIGNDSRVQMLDLLDIKHVFVNEADVDTITKTYHTLIETQSEFEVSILKLIQQTRKDYLNLLKEV